MPKAKSGVLSFLNISKCTNAFVLKPKTINSNKNNIFFFNLRNKSPQFYFVEKRVPQSCTSYFCLEKDTSIYCRPINLFALGPLLLNNFDRKPAILQLLNIRRKNSGNVLLTYLQYIETKSINFL